MDKEQARFILRSFRPDGADAGDPDFAEALQLALEDRELGEWLAGERAFDADFARALGSVDLPGNLHRDIMACLAAERGDLPAAADRHDAEWIDAFASIQPPDFLRERVIAAMERTAAPAKGPVVLRLVRRWSIPFAAAAGVALAFMTTRQPEPAAPVAQVRAETIPVAAVKAGFVKTLESPAFQLEKKREDHQVLVNHLRQHKLPCPDNLPPGLRGRKGLGCREMVIDGKRGSLICFNLGEDGIVHLVILRRDDVSGEFERMERAAFDDDGKWASACWSSRRNVYILMSKQGAGKLSELF